MHQDSYNCITGFLDLYWIVCPIDRRSTTGYYVIAGDNLSWKIEKLAIIFRSSTKSEYRIIVDFTSVLIFWRDAWVDILCLRLQCGYIDNRSAICTEPGDIWRTKNTKVDCHVVWEKYDVGIIKSKHVSSNQHVNWYTKPLGRSRI